MRIRILGAGFYGCHIARALIREGHDVEVHEIADRIFAGASGNIPARLHAGFHYPRSRLTRAACQEHAAEFMVEYGFLTRAVPTNIYAIAKDRSMIDFAQYVATLRGETEFLTMHDPEEFGLRNVEGAIQVGERHILTNEAHGFFESKLRGAVTFGVKPGDHAADEYDWTIDCTFCAQDSAGVDRYEPCLVVMMEGPTDKAVTIMDGPFPSLYPWDEDNGLCSLSSALWTPFSKTCRTWADARELLAGLAPEDIEGQASSMVESMAHFYPAVREYARRHHRLSIRAMPLSGADTRLVDVRVAGPRMIRIRAGKIDAIMAAERAVREIMA